MGPDDASPSMSNSPVRLRLTNTFAALRYRNFRLWFSGQIVSLFGTWMQTTARGFLIYELTRAPAYLGYASFASGTAIWLFMPYGGVVADRVPRRTVLVCTQSHMMLLVFVLEMVGREDLTNAIALKATMFDAAMAVGPAASGLVYAWLQSARGVGALAGALLIASLGRFRLDACRRPLDGPDRRALQRAGRRGCRGPGHPHLHRSWPPCRLLALLACY